MSSTDCSITDSIKRFNLLSIVQTSRLLALPGELRNHIYEYVLRENEVIDVPLFGSVKPPALFAVCRRIRTEARLIYVTDNIFRITVSDLTPLAIPKFLAGLTTEEAKAMRHLIFHYQYMPSKIVDSMMGRKGLSVEDIKVVEGIKLWQVMISFPRTSNEVRQAWNEYWSKFDSLLLGWACLFVKLQRLGLPLEVCHFQPEAKDPRTVRSHEEAVAYVWATKIGYLFPSGKPCTQRGRWYLQRAEQILASEEARAREKARASKRRGLRLKQYPTFKRPRNTLRSTRTLQIDWNVQDPNASLVSPAEAKLPTSDRQTEPDQPRLINRPKGAEAKEPVQGGLVPEQGSQEKETIDELTASLTSTTLKDNGDTPSRDQQLITSMRSTIISRDPKAVFEDSRGWVPMPAELAIALERPEAAEKNRILTGDTCDNSNKTEDGEACSKSVDGKAQETDRLRAISASDSFPSLEEVKAAVSEGDLDVWQLAAKFWPRIKESAGEVQRFITLYEGVGKAASDLTVQLEEEEKQTVESSSQKDADATKAAEAAKVKAAKAEAAKAARAAKAAKAEKDFPTVKDITSFIPSRGVSPEIVDFWFGHRVRAVAGGRERFRGLLWQVAYKNSWGKFVLRGNSEAQR